MSTPPAPKAGAFHPEALRQIRQSTSLKLDGVLSHQLMANVSICVHPNRRTVLTAYYGLESRLDLWDLSARSHLQSLHLTSGDGAGAMTGIMILGPAGPVSGTALPIRDMSLSPSGELFAVGCANVVRLFAIEGGVAMSELIELDGGQKGVHGVSFSHNGDLLACASDDGKVIVWSVARHHILSRFTLEACHLRAVAFSHDDLLVACGDTNGNIAVWDVVTGHQLAWFQGHASEVSALAFAPQGYLMATSGFDGLVKLWDMSSSRPFGEPMCHGDSVYDLAFSQDGALLYSCSFDHNVGVWRLDHQQLIDAYEDDDAVLALALTPGEEKILLVTSSAIKSLDNRQRANAAVAQPGGAAVDSEAAAAALSSVLNASIDSMIASMDAEISVDGDVIVGELGVDYLKARRQTEARPAAPNFDAAPPAPPPPPGPISLPVGGDSEPLIPARFPSAMSAIAEEAAVQRKASERLERRIASRSRLSIIFSMGVGLFCALVAFATTPSPRETDEFVQRTAPINADFERESKEEEALFASNTQRVQQQIDKIKKTPGATDRRTMIARLEEITQKENERHKAAIDRITQQREVLLTSAEAGINTRPLLRLIGGGLSGAAISLLILWLLLSTLLKEKKARPS